MTADSPFPVLFCAAAGPRVGFGHLVRCRSLARALDVPPVVALHGGRRTRAAAAALGLLVLPTHTPVAATGASLVVIDDPSSVRARAWVRRARRAGVPVASVHDLGLAYVDADLLIDGTVRPGVAPVGSDLLAGPDYAILDGAFDPLASPLRRPVRDRVLVALGGGRHVRAIATRLCAALATTAPLAHVRVIEGFTPGARPALANGAWVQAPNGLASELAAAQVAVVAGGVTLYEACAVGVPAVGLAVTPAQHDTIRGVSRVGAAVDGGCLTTDPRACERAAAAVARLLGQPELAARQSVLSRRLVDGRGARRVADRLEALLRRHGRPRPSSVEVLARAC